MVSSEEPAPTVHGHKLSTVSTGSVTGENVVHELTNMDLIMKNHYFRIVYFFRQSEAIDGLTITKLKGPMFPVLDLLYPVTGRVRRTVEGRPLIKCNDCGVRIVEAMCGKTVDEWLESKDASRWRQLVPDKVLGPQLHFSPTIYVQFTKFKCGGMSVGYGWAHILGDAISAIDCFNMYGQILSGCSPRKSVQLRDNASEEERQTTSARPLSVKQVEPNGEHWLIPNTSKLSTLFLELKEIMPETTQPFETISAIIWYCLARLRAGREPKVVTVCRYDASATRNVSLANELKIGSVCLELWPVGVGYPELAALISREERDETKAINGLIDDKTGKPDFLLYGTNLTFVDMQGVDFQGFELKGQKPIQIDCAIDGVGDEGAVLVYKNVQRSEQNGSRAAMMILPEHEIPEIEVILKSEFGIA